jgi:glucose-6-phosphate-specific signal transduction histidine kinase
LYLIQSNRRLFAQLAALSEQRSELAQKLISTQESTLLYISRELHDEFGQILTAIGSMLSRARNHVPEDSPLRAQLREVSEIAQSTLDKVRVFRRRFTPSCWMKQDLRVRLTGTSRRWKGKPELKYPT